MQFRLVDGVEITARSYRDVVRQMGDMKMSPAKDLARYRRKTASRAREVYRATIDPSTDKTFVEGMVSAGLMARLDGN